MKTSDILKMEPGLKIRDLIAKKVMKFELYEPEPFDDRFKKYWRDPATKQARSIDAWRPDLSKNCMHEILEKCHSFSIGCPSNNGNYYALIQIGMNKGLATADTMELAVCRAALISVMYNELEDK